MIQFASILTTIDVVVVQYLRSYLLPFEHRSYKPLLTPCPVCCIKTLVAGMRLTIRRTIQVHPLQAGSKQLLAPLEIVMWRVDDLQFAQTLESWKRFWQRFKIFFRNVVESFLDAKTVVVLHPEVLQPDKMMQIKPVWNMQIFIIGNCASCEKRKLYWALQSFYDT